jgi:hypothetical protein
MNDKRLEELLKTDSAGKTLFAKQTFDALSR